MTEQDLIIQDLKREIAQYEAKLNEIGNAPLMRWISVEDRLPHFNGEYIVCCDDSNEDSDMQIWGQHDVIAIGNFQNGLWAWEENGTEYDLTGLVTHWMPFPKPPIGV